MAVVTLKPQETSNKHVTVIMPIRVSGDHTPEGTVLLLPEGTARYLIACNKVRESTPDEITKAKAPAKAAA